LLRLAKQLTGLNVKKVYYCCGANGDKDQPKCAYITSDSGWCPPLPCYPVPEITMPGPSKRGASDLDAGGVWQACLPDRQEAGVQQLYVACRQSDRDDAARLFQGIRG